MNYLINNNKIFFNYSFKRFYSLHYSALTGFTKDNIKRYEVGRPSYSIETIQVVNEIIKQKYLQNNDNNDNDKGCSLLEIGAGTGKFTKSYLNEIYKFNWLKNYNYIALEPSEFVEHLKQLPLNIQVIKGLAENIPVENESIDAVLIAQAFHWMDNEKSIQEIHRVLKPGCPLILIWNGYDTTLKWLEQYQKQIIIPHYPPDTPRYQTGNWEKVFNSKIGRDLFTSINKTICHNEIRGDLSMVINRALSTSVISNKSDDIKQQVQEQILTLLSTHPETKDIPRDSKNGYVMKYQTLIASTYKK